VRVVITFQDGRTLVYSWGNREGRGESFASWAGRNRMVIVLQRAEDADGSWHVERRDRSATTAASGTTPQTDRLGWGTADTDGLKVRAAAEIGDITWMGP